MHSFVVRGLHSPKVDIEELKNTIQLVLEPSPALNFLAHSQVAAK